MEKKLYSFTKEVRFDDRDFCTDIIVNLCYIYRWFWYYKNVENSLLQKLKRKKQRENWIVVRESKKEYILSLFNLGYCFNSSQISML